MMQIVFEIESHMDKLESQYWMNQFISDDQHQIDHDGILHKFMRSNVVPECYKSNAPVKNKIESKSEDNAKVATGKRGPPSESLSATKQPKYETVSDSSALAATIESLSSAMESSLKSTPRKINISLTYEL